MACVSPAGLLPTALAVSHGGVRSRAWVCPRHSGPSSEADLHELMPTWAQENLSSLGLPSGLGMQVTWNPPGNKGILWPGLCSDLCQGFWQVWGCGACSWKEQGAQAVPKPQDEK